MWSSAGMVVKDGATLVYCQERRQRLLEQVQQRFLEFSGSFRWTAGAAEFTEFEVQPPGRTANDEGLESVLAIAPAGKIPTQNFRNFRAGGGRIRG